MVRERAGESGAGGGDVGSRPRAPAAAGGGHVAASSASVASAERAKSRCWSPPRDRSRFSFRRVSPTNFLFSVECAPCVATIFSLNSADYPIGRILKMDHAGASGGGGGGGGGGAASDASALCLQDLVSSGGAGLEHHHHAASHHPHHPHHHHHHHHQELHLNHPAAHLMSGDHSAVGTAPPPTCPPPPPPLHHEPLEKLKRGRSQFTIIFNFFLHSHKRLLNPK